MGCQREDHDLHTHLKMSDGVGGRKSAASCGSGRKNNCVSGIEVALHCWFREGQDSASVGSRDTWHGDGPDGLKP